jgi:hypothetical protein
LSATILEVRSNMRVQAMPVHNWKRVDAGLFHAFHQTWITYLTEALNDGRLPEGYYAIQEQNTQPVVPDILALSLGPRLNPNNEPTDFSDLPVATAPPKARVVRRVELGSREEEELYADKVDRISIRHRHGIVVAIIEIVSPGNKSSKRRFRAFVDKAVYALLSGVHLMVIDLHRPTKRDPQGIHKALWDEFCDEDFKLPKRKPFTIASYSAGDEDQPDKVAYVENVGVGEALPDMPIFLTASFHVMAPLETSYRSAWKVFPKQLKGLLENPNP